MNSEDHKFLHDVTNKLAKIDGFTGILKIELGGVNDKIVKIERATNEAIELVKNYRALLESKEQNKDNEED